MCLTYSFFFLLELVNRTLTFIIEPNRINKCLISIYKSIVNKIKKVLTKDKKRGTFIITSTENGFKNIYEEEKNERIRDKN